jgi:hypothetical protein
MSDSNRTGTILIRTGTPLPPDLIIETEAFLPGWNAVKKLDGYGLGRKMQELNWSLFYLAGEIRATVVGRRSDASTRQAVKRILATLKGRKFNALEITKVATSRFFGVPYLRVFAHSRHIQASQYLAPAKDSFLKTSGASAAQLGRGNNGQEVRSDSETKQLAAAVSGS